MTLDNVNKLLEAIAKLLSVLAWPAVAVFVLLRFGPALREFIAAMGEFSLKGGGFEWSAKRRQAEAAAALAAAAVSHPEARETPPDPAREARTAKQVVAEVVTPRVMRRAGRATVLWVDDRTRNNVHEREALEALGVNFVLATATEEALQKAKDERFDAVISDMGRPGDPRAGYTLLEKLRAEGDYTPFIIYAGSRAPEHVAEARQKGALGCTNSPNELFEMVLSVLGWGARN